MFYPPINKNNPPAESNIPTTDTPQASNVGKAAKAALERADANELNESNNTIFKKLAKSFSFLLNTTCKPAKIAADYLYNAAIYLYNNSNAFFARSYHFASIVITLGTCTK